MSTDPNNCLGCLKPPCLIHDNHCPNSPSCSKASRSLRSSQRIKDLRAGKASTSGRCQSKRKSLKSSSSKRKIKRKPIRKSQRVIKRAGKTDTYSESSTRSEIIHSHNVEVENLPIQGAEITANGQPLNLIKEQPHCSQQRQSSTDAVNDHQVETTSVNENAEEENEPSSSFVSQGQRQTPAAPPTAQTSAEREMNKTPLSVCVVRPFSHIAMPNDIQSSIQEMDVESLLVARNPSSPTVEGSGRLISQNMDVVQPSVQRVREHIRTGIHDDGPSTSQARLREMSQVVTNFVQQPIVESTGRQTPHTIDVAQPLLARVREPVRESNPDTRENSSQVRPRNILHDFRNFLPPPVESNGRQNTSIQRVRGCFGEVYLSETSMHQRGNVVTASQNASVTPNNTISQAAQSYVAQERRGILHQVQTGRMNSNTNNLNRELITVEEAARLDAVNRNTNARIEILSNYVSALSEFIVSRINPMPPFAHGVLAIQGRQADNGQRGGPAQNAANQQILLETQPQAFVGGPNYPIHSNRANQGLPQSNSLPYTGEQFPGATRATVHVNEHIISVENRMSNQNIPNIPNIPVSVVGFQEHMIPRRLMQENPHSIPQVASMPPEYNMQLQRNFRRTHHPTSTVVSDTINQYQRSPINDQRIYERFMHGQSVSERYGPYQLSSMVSGGPYPNNSQRPYNIEPSAGRYGPTVVDGPSQNFSQQPLITESVAGRFGPTVSYGPHNNQRSSSSESTTERQVAGSPDENTSDDQSSSTESNLGSQSTNSNYPFQQTSSMNMYNRTQTYENQIFPDRNWQPPPQMNLVALADPRMTREPMQNLPPSTINLQHRYQRSENLSSPPRYFLQQPPPTFQMTSNSSASQQANWINQQPVPYRSWQYQGRPEDVYRF